VAKVKVTLDHKGIGELLNSAQVRGALPPFAEGIAAAARARNPRDGVAVDTFTTRGMRSNRTAMSVTVKDYRAMLWQARDGMLTRAASSVGLEVKAKR
jgi:hypothetical protein